MLSFSLGAILYNSRSVEKDLHNQLDKLTAFSKELPWADQDFDPVLPTTNHESHPPFTETQVLNNLG